LNSVIYNPIFWIFLSYAFGQIIADYLLKKKKVDWFENHNYIDDKLTKSLGILVFGWLVKNTFMGWFNKKLKLSAAAGIEDLQVLKREMTASEAGHLVAFYFLLIVNIVLVFMGLEWWYIIVFFIMNVIFNMYLVLLQQYNKRRIERILFNKTS